MKLQESILVVDDDLDFLGIIRRILENKGYEVVTAASASEALSCLKGRFYHAAILDISLPDANGTELLSTIIGMHPDIIAIMLTGHSSVQNAVESLNRGAFAYLEKPIAPDNLLSVIKRGLEKQRLTLENRQLVEELEHRNRTANTLLGMSQVVSQSLDLQKIIESALEEVARHNDIEAAFVYLRKNGGLGLAGQRGFSPKVIEAIEKEIAGDGGALSGILKKVEPTVIDDTTTPDAAGLSFLSRGGYRSFVGVPLTVLGESIGVMGVATVAERRFTAPDIQLLTGIGREIAIAVRNAQLYEEASSAKSLRELDAMRTEFLANISHELRTPLAVIKGSANSLLQPDVIFDEDTRREFLQSIDKDADTLSRLVDDLLMLSRLEANALEMRLQTHHLSDIFDAVKDRLDKLTARHHLSIDLPANLPPVIADDGRIGEVLTNLVDNAVKYSDDNTRIAISANPNCKDVTVSVADEGAGIPPEMHQKVFERFFQGNGQKQGRRKGAGLGLAICRGIIEAHGGRIWVESEPGKGAKFSFSLPVAQKR